MLRINSIFSTYYNSYYPNIKTNISIKDQYIVFQIFKKHGFNINFLIYINILINLNTINISKDKCIISIYYFIKMLNTNIYFNQRLFFSTNINFLFKINTKSNFLKNQTIFNKYLTLGLIKGSQSIMLIPSYINNNVIFNNITITNPKFSSSSICKIISSKFSKNMEFQFLRKNKVYNKGRYSRCRQNYRTGVYLCMYLSVVSIFGLYYWFYKFSFNFSYLWWFFFIFISSFFSQKIIKYRLYEPVTLFNSFIGSVKWFSILIKSFFK